MQAFHVLLMWLAGFHRRSYSPPFKRNRLSEPLIYALDATKRTRKTIPAHGAKYLSVCEAKDAEPDSLHFFLISGEC